MAFNGFNGIQGHLVWLAVRAVGALRTASPPPGYLRWMFIAFVLAMILMLAERKVHAPVVLTAVTWPHAWGAYRQHLIERGLAASSIGQYRFRLNTWRYWLWHPPRGRHRKDWWQATTTDLTSFLGRKCQPKHLHAGQPMSPATRAMYSSSIPLLYHVCYAQGLIDADPFAGYRPLQPPRPSPRPLDLDEVRRFLLFCREHEDPRLFPAACLCFYDALRGGEPTLLTVDDVSLDGGEPRVNVLGKGRDVRDWFPLHSAVVPALRRYLPWLASRHDVADWRQLPAGTPLLQSLTQVGAGIDRKTLIRLLARAMRDAQVQGRPHDLRRTGANLVAEAFDDNPGPLRFALRHQGWTSLDSYRVVSLAKGRGYLEAIPDLLASGVEPVPT